MSKFSAYGAALLLAGDEIAQVTNISGPSLSLDTTDVTTHDQSLAWEEHAATILRTGTLTLDIIYDPGLADHVGVLATLVGKAAVEFELQFPDPAYTSYVFDAFVTGFTPTAPVDGALTASVTLKPTGEPTLNSTYSP